MTEKKKVILGMSGGVDSSVAALLLKKQGYEVYGYFMNCSPSGKTLWPSSINWEEEEKGVRKICELVGVKELFVRDCEQGYEENIIKKMFRDYSKGLTPNPDILCNNVGKFPGLMRLAERIGADFIATGHYARTRPPARNGGNYQLLMGKDKEKDQSYFLFGLPQKNLSKCLFPIGELTKNEVREIAKKNGFPNWDKRSSRGVCYLGKIDFKKFLRERIKEKHGKVLDPEGNLIGTHPGIMFFTIGEKVGEKKGFVIDKEFKRKTGNAKLFVAKKRRGNILVIAPEGYEILKTKKVFIKGFGLINPREKISGKKLNARIRHLGELYSGKLKKEGGKWNFEFDKGVEGVAEGQIIVLHDKERLVCGGEIRLR